jgi:hypothetical protein
MRESDKPTLLTRREILASGVAMAGTISFLPTARAATAPEPAAALSLTAGTRTLSVNGKAARVFSLIGPNGKPGITLSPGEGFHVDLSLERRLEALTPLAPRAPDATHLTEVRYAGIV